jgi:hypothetical protein
VGHEAEVGDPHQDCLGVPTYQGNEEEVVWRTIYSLRTGVW